MALVDYSDSESDSETVAQPQPQPSAKAPPAAATTAKKPIQKVVDRSNPRKIVVNLSGASGSDESSQAKDGDEPPAKRARTGGGAFGGFASLLPPPKSSNKPKQTVSSSSTGGSSSSRPPPRVGINLKTGATPGFSRGGEDEDDEGGSASKQPSIPEGQRPADEVKLVGKPLMFKPLSVSRKPKKNGARQGGVQKATTAYVPAPASSIRSEAQPAPVEEEKPKKKMSLFSISAEDDDNDPSTASSSTGAYEPLVTNAAPSAADDFSAYDAQYGSAYSQEQQQQHAALAAPAPANSIDAMAADLKLSAAERRALFGRSGAPTAAQASASRLITFDTDREYAHNEALRASGELEANTHNPVRALAPGKHSLRQLVTQVHNQRDALEESFAKGRANRNEAGARYGWR
jgi:hypothetical protein